MNAPAAAAPEAQERADGSQGPRLGRKAENTARLRACLCHDFRQAAPRGGRLPGRWFVCRHCRGEAAPSDVWWWNHGREMGRAEGRAEVRALFAVGCGNERCEGEAAG